MQHLHCDAVTEATIGVAAAPPPQKEILAGDIQPVTPNIELLSFLLDMGADPFLKVPREMPYE